MCGRVGSPPGALIRQRVRGGGSCGPPAWYRVRPPLLVWLVWRISARVARACCALVIVARGRYLIVTNAILIYKKGTERSKTAPKTLMLTMHADMALRAACVAAGCGRPHVANFDARDGYGASMSTSTTTAG